MIFTNPVTIDYDILQQDIDQTSIWGEQSLMCFNIDKCHVMTIGTVQLKGNLTQVDRAHTTYWLKARGFIGMCRKENLPKLIFKRQECGLRKH